MTLAELRAALIEILDNAIEEQWMPDALLHAISAAGFFIVGPEVTPLMIEIARELIETSVSGFRTDDLFKAMLAAGDLARKP